MTRIAAATSRITRPLARPLRPAARHLRRYFDTLSVGGMIMALLFFCFSMTPSLLPRP